MNLQTETVIELKGTRERRAIRRPILTCIDSGLVLESETVYVYRKHPNASLNTQIAVLSDLKFFRQWQHLRCLSDPRWITPLQRILKGRSPLRPKEIADLARWMSHDAETLSRAVELAIEKVEEPVTGPAVEAATKNRKIRTVAAYLGFLIRDAGVGADIKRAVLSKQIEEDFSTHLVVDKKMPEVRSLSDTATRHLHDFLQNPASFPNTQVGRRNRLIVATFYETGLRPGEFLKLRCSDVDNKIEYAPNKFATCISVVHRRHDRHDTRLHEPAAKTLPGVLPISHSLAREIEKYIFTDRAETLSLASGSLTPYLFINHRGPQSGHPMSQRRVNQVFQELRTQNSLIASLVPYILRHTHLNETYEQANLSGKNARDILIQRGRWSESSTMPGRYAQRSIQKSTAKIVAERESILNGNAKK